jgi:hypothetical protein
LYGQTGLPFVVRNTAKVQMKKPSICPALFFVEIWWLRQLAAAKAAIPSETMLTDPLGGDDIYDPDTLAEYLQDYY